MNDKERIHIVKRRESLKDIAKKYYGRKKGKHWKKIFAANKKKIGVKPKRLKPGMKLIIPVLGPAPQPPTPQDVPLLYNFDRMAIWNNRLGNLVGGILTATSEVMRIASMDSTAVTEQDRKEFDIQKWQVQILGLFAIDLGSYLNWGIGNYISSLLPPEWIHSEQNTASPTYLLRSVFHQASTDLEIIQKAIFQRQLVAAKEEEGHTLSQMGRMLVLADLLAYRAMQPAEKLMKPGFDPQEDKPQVIVTFFSETTHIRQLPYQQDLILLSIPFASVSVNAGDIREEGLGNKPTEESWIPIDLLAIPHELGHHIFFRSQDEFFRQAKKAKLTIPQGLDAEHGDEAAAQPVAYARWIEELFADIYGCFIAGPISVLGLQAILADASPQEWLSDDGHHPVPALRPFITTDILRQLSKHDVYPAKFKDAPDLLDKNWEAILRRQGIISAEQPSFKKVAFACHTDDHEIETISVKQVRKAFSKIIKFYIDALVTFCDMENFKPWSQDESTLAAYDQVLRDLVHDVRQDKYRAQDHYPASDASTYKHSDDFVAEIRAILAKWNFEGPEGGHVD